MIDIHLVRNNPDIIREDLRKRGMGSEIVEQLLEVDNQWKEALQQTEKLKEKRNRFTEKIKDMKSRNEDASELIEDVKKLPDLIKENDEQARALAGKRRQLLMRIPNILHESVPVGEDETKNVEIRKWGKPPEFGFEPKSHEELGKLLDVIEIERAAKTSGARFYYLKNELVQIQKALEFLILESLKADDFQLFEVPHMLKRDAYEGTVDLEDFENVMYKMEGEELYLIATSEHPLAAYHKDEVIDIEAPLRYAAVSPCYRKEAGSHGKDTKGIFRVHQFDKVEQFVFCHPEDSWNEHEMLLKRTEALMQALELPYRIVNVCTGDIGTIAAKKYDLEVWMPAQNKYRELVSCSNCTDYQARRLNIRYEKDGERFFVHTLNSTATAFPRLFVALLENNQHSDGSVDVPKALWKYLDFKSIKPKF